MNGDQLGREADDGTVERLEKAASKLPLRDLQRLIEGLKEREANKLREEAEKAEFWEDLRGLLELVDSRPFDATASLAAMAERAVHFGTCETIQVLGLRSFQKKLLGDLRAAEADLNAAWRLAPHCPTGYCRLDLLRRQAKLDLALGRGPDAIHGAEECLQGYRDLGGAGHDLHGFGEGSALFVRADIRSALGDHAGAAKDLSDALVLFPPRSRIWTIAHRNLAAVLFEVGGAERKRAYKMLRKPRYHFRNPAEKTVEWAHFWWLDSQLALATGGRKDRALAKLEEVSQVFLGQRMPVHFSGVVHDIARVHYPSTGDIRSYLEGVPDIRDRKISGFFGEILGLACTRLTSLDSHSLGATNIPASVGGDVSQPLTRGFPRTLGVPPADRCPESASGLAFQLLLPLVEPEPR